MPIQKFKANQAKLKAEQFSHDLQIADIDQKKLEQINQSAHYVKNGFLFTSEDKENVQLPTQNFLALRKIAEEGVKAVAQIHLLNDDIQQLRHDEALARSDLSFFLHELHRLEKSTKNYADVPKFWRNHIDDSINFWKKTFTNYCHDAHRATVKVFIATHGNFEKTYNIMHDIIKNIGVKNVEKHIADSIRSAKRQLKSHTRPEPHPPSWKPPKPEQTDYQKPDETNLIPPPSFAQLGCDDINWDMISWNLLTELAKDEILHKKIYREL